MFNVWLYVQLRVNPFLADSFSFIRMFCF